MPTDQSTMPNPKPRWYRLTPGRLLAVLLAVEGGLLLSERWFPKGWAVLIAVAAVGVFLLVMLLWFAIALIFRRRFQFSLRSLMLLTIAVAIPSSWLAVEMKWANEQNMAVTALKRFPGIIEYEAETPGQHAISFSTPLWLRSLLGDFFFEDVFFVCLGGGEEFTDADMVHIESLPELKRLVLSSCHITDTGLQHIHKLTHLRALSPGKYITDAGLRHLKGLTQLQELNLNNTKITDAGLEYLEGLDGVQSLILRKTKITNAGLEHLKRLPMLTKVNLQETQVTDAGVANLQKALPNCEIIH